MFAYAFAGRDITGKSVEDMVYEVQRKVILEIAEIESCLIIGRNAAFILNDRDDVLNVFIHGDKAEKVKRICKLYNVKAEFYTRTSAVEWLGEGMDNIFIILGIRFIISLFVMSIAYICGSMFYRLKMKYNILVFILILGILFGGIFNILFSNRYIGDKLGTIMWSITCFVEKPIITIILEILFTVLFIIIGNKFCVDTPIFPVAIVYLFFSFKFKFTQVNTQLLCQKNESDKKTAQASNP